MTESDYDGEKSDGEIEYEQLSDQEKELYDINVEIEKLYVIKNNVEDGYNYMWNSVIVPYLKLTEKTGILDKLDHKHDRCKFFKFMINNNKTYREIIQCLQSLKIIKNKILFRTRNAHKEEIIEQRTIKSKKKIWSKDTNTSINMNKIMDEEQIKLPELAKSEEITKSEEIEAPVIMKLHIANKLRHGTTIWDILSQKKNQVNLNQGITRGNIIPLTPEPNTGYSDIDNSKGGNNGLINEGINILSVP